MNQEFYDLVSSRMTGFLGTYQNQGMKVDSIFFDSMNRTANVKGLEICVMPGLYAPRRVGKDRVNAVCYYTHFCQYEGSFTILEAEREFFKVCQEFGCFDYSTKSSELDTPQHGLKYMVASSWFVSDECCKC